MCNSGETVCEISFNWKEVSFSNLVLHRFFLFIWSKDVEKWVSEVFYNLARKLSMPKLNFHRPKNIKRDFFPDLSLGIRVQQRYIIVLMLFVTLSIAIALRVMFTIVLTQIVYIPNINEQTRGNETSVQRNLICPINSETTQVQDNIPNTVNAASPVVKHSRFVANWK